MYAYMKDVYWKLERTIKDCNGSHVMKIPHPFSNIIKRTILGAWKPYHSLLYILLDCHISLRHG
jgi:hypothetical protein